MSEGAAHWDAAYERGANQVSWFEDEARTSLDLIARAAVAPDTPVIDVGGGASPLTAELLDLGHTDLTVLDISQAALDAARARLGSRAAQVGWIRSDLRAWRPARDYGLWHDRAVLHFLTDPGDQRHYAALVARALAAGGHAVIGTFALDGPERCSGLPVTRHSPESLAGLLGDDFETIVAQHHTHTTPGGSRQAFTWIVARRTGG